MTRRLALLSLLLVAGATCAAAADVTTIDALMEKHVAALGGKDLLLAAKSLIATGTFAMPGQGLKGKMAIYGKAPDKAFHAVSLEGIGDVKKGYDGKVAWTSDPFQGLREMTGVERDMFVREADFRGPLHWKELFPQVEFLGKAMLGEKPVYKVKMTPATGDAELRSFDADGFLLVQVEMMVDGPSGKVPVIQTFSDYRKVGGLVSPFHMETTVGGISAAVIDITELKYDEAIPDETFVMPAVAKPVAAPGVPAPAPEAAPQPK
jgi:hypothetical protein